MGPVWLSLRAGLRLRWRVLAALPVLLGVIGGIVLAPAAYPRLLQWANAAQVDISPAGVPGWNGPAGYYAALARLPQVASVGTAVWYNVALPVRHGRPTTWVQAFASPDQAVGASMDRVKILQGWRAARSSGITAKVTREPPAPLTVEPPGLSESNYAGWAAEYGVTGLTPPPALTVWVNKVFEIPELEHQKDLSNNDFVVMTKSGYIEVPAGYVAVYATGDESKASWGTGAEQLRAHVGNSVLDLVDGPRDKTMSGLSGQVEVAVFLYDFKAATVDIKLECTRTDEAYAQWQLSTYEKIADAYQAQLDAYLAEVNTATTAETVTRAELSPDAKRRVELDELKRATLTIVSSSDFSHRNAVSGPTDAAPIPVTDPTWP